MVLRDLRSLVEERVESNVTLIVYEDDIIILCRSRDKAERLLGALNDALNTHIAGPFRLGIGQIIQICDPFDFPGCQSSRTPAGAVKQDVLEARKCDHRFFIDAELAQSVWPSCPPPASVLNRIAGLRGAYSDCRAYLAELAELAEWVQRVPRA